MTTPKKVENLLDINVRAGDSLGSRKRQYMDNDNLAKVLLQVVQAQDSMNSLVHPDWHLQDFDFYLAAHTEAGEALGHTRWEFWKNLGSNEILCFETVADMREYHMEMVDILHFLVSALLQPYKGRVLGPYLAAQALLEALADATADADADDCSDYPEDLDIPGLDSNYGAPRTGAELGKVLIRHTQLLSKACIEQAWKDAIPHLLNCVTITGYGLEGLLAGYFAKSELNMLRQRNGYKTKEYIKAWGEKGEEDNVFLATLVGEQLVGYTPGQLSGVEGTSINRRAAVLLTLSSGAWQHELRNSLEGLYSMVKKGDLLVQ